MLKKIRSVLSVCLAVLTGAALWVPLLSVQAADGIHNGRVEAEDCVDTENHRWKIEDDSAASGGKIVATTEGQTLTFENIPEFNRLVITAASKNNDNTFTVRAKAPGGESDVTLATPLCPRTYSWQMDNSTQIVIDGYSFPEGSTLYLDFGLTINIDCIDFYTTNYDNLFSFEAENSSFGADCQVKEDALASGGKYLDLPVNNSVTFTNVGESNCIELTYASSDNGSFFVEIFDNCKWVSKGSIYFSTTVDATIASRMKAVSDIIYIPDGSTVRLTAKTKAILDCVEFKNGNKSESDLDQSYLLAKNTPEGEKSTVKNLMALTGVAVKTEADYSYTFTLPSSFDGEYNRVVVFYRTEKGGTAKIQDTEFTLSKAETKEFNSTVISLEQELTPGQNLIFTSPSDDLILDYIKLSYLETAEIVTVDSLPEAGQRKTVKLNGIWDCFAEEDITANPASIGVPTSFENTMTVPGFWDMASIPLGSYNGKMLWVKKTVVMPEDFDPENSSTVVRLEILRALYGRYIYINGNYVDSYQYDFTYSHSDITKYLKKGQNEIYILLGSQEKQNEFTTEDGGHIHYGRDSEKMSYMPGITDDVNLILTGTTYTKAVQVAPHINDGTVDIQVKLESTVTGNAQITVNFYELGIVSNGISARRAKVGTYTENASVTSGEETIVSAKNIKINDFSKEKYWEPENPYLYEIEVVLGNDCYSKRFGMKEFYFNAATNKPMLNGKVYNLRGTNVAMYRFYEDPDRGSLPWSEDFVRKLYSEFFSVNWEIFRSHIGPLPSLWYDIADEMGMMIVDEYAIFGYCDKCTTESLLPEYRAMVEEKQTHPSILYWDAQNEAAEDGSDWGVTTEAIKTLLEENVDISGRTWDNGWSLPNSNTSPIECHPYPFMSGENIDYLNSILGMSKKPWNCGANKDNTDNPKIINEYASLWVNRVGEPTSISKKNYDKLIPNATAEECLEFYAYSTTTLTEFFRSGRNISGIMLFTGLSYSKPGQQGATSDVLDPDIANPTIRTELKESLKNSFAPLSITLAKYDITVGPGKQTWPVILVNDYNKAINKLPVTVVVTSNGNEICRSETQYFDLGEAGTETDNATADFTFTIPADALNDGDDIDIKAIYTLDDVSVYSKRSLTFDAEDLSINDSISQNKEVTVSSTASDRDKTWAVDGDEDTRWGSVYQNNVDNTKPWISIDLGKKYDLSQMMIKWETARPVSYKILISNDGVNYSLFDTVDEVEIIGQRVSLKGATARYVKIEAESCVVASNGVNYGISIFEWYIWGDEAAFDPSSQMLHITSAANKWGAVSRRYSLENGKEYTFTAEYCVDSSNLAENSDTSSGKDVFIIEASNGLSGTSQDRLQNYITASGKNTISFNWTPTVSDKINFGVNTNSKDGTVYDAYIWNLKVTETETGKEITEFTEIADTTLDSITAAWEDYDENKFITVYKLESLYTDSTLSWNTARVTTASVSSGVYNIDFDYYIAYDGKLTTNENNNIFFKTQGYYVNNDKHKDDNAYISSTGKGHHTNRYTLSSNGALTFELATRTNKVQDVVMYFWNIKITDDQGNEVPYSINISSKGTYNPAELGYRNPMYVFTNTASQWNTVEGTFYNLPNDTYTLKFDYYVSKDISLSTDKNILKTLLNWKNGGGRKAETYASKSGVYSHSQEFTVDGNQLYFEVGANKKSGTDFTVYIWNLRLEDSHGNAYYTYFKTNNNVTEQAYDEEDMINTVGAMPVVLGAKIKTDLSKVDAEQKLRIDVDFTNINEFADIKEYGVIAVPANKADMTLSDILDTDSKQQVTRYKEADGDAGLVSVIVTRGVNSYGKRIALVAYVKTANGTYYTDVISKSVMGVMKSIFSSETNLATEGITADKITTAHSSIVENNIITGKTVDEISKIFKDYTGYGNTTPTIVVGNNDYENAKKITAATFFYAKHS